MLTLTRREFLKLGLAAVLFPSPGTAGPAPLSQPMRQFEFPLTFPVTFGVLPQQDERRQFLPLIYNHTGAGT